VSVMIICLYEAPCVGGLSPVQSAIGNKKGPDKPTLFPKFGGNYFPDLEEPERVLERALLTGRDLR